jgi:hypothetical protein
MASTTTFKSQVTAYNETFWPVSVAMVLAAVYLTYRVFWRPGARTDLWIKLFLSTAFAWNGIVFLMVYLKNPVSMFTGAPLFIIASLLCAIDVRTRKTQFRAPEATWKKAMTAFWIVLVFLYPVLGWPLARQSATG